MDPAKPRPLEWTAWALPLAVVVPMLALASALDKHAIIFPEGAALVMGIWVLGLPGWSASRWRVAALPPLFALAGVLLLRLDLPPTATAILAVALALLALQAFDTRLAPAMSAAVLPIVFDVRAWSYPLAVLAISLVVAAGMACLPLRLTTRRADATPGRSSPARDWRSRRGSSSAASCWRCRARRSRRRCSCRRRLAQPRNARRIRGAAAVALLAGAALWARAPSPSCPSHGSPVRWRCWPRLRLMRVLATPHPPALAIALVPQILDATDPAGFTLAVAAGAGALYLAILGLDRARRRASWA